MRNNILLKKGIMFGLILLVLLSLSDIFFNDYDGCSVLIGKSMQPLIRNGNTVCFSNNIVNLKVGDIITFKQNNKIITHKIIDIGENGFGKDVYVTKGENNQFLDEPVYEEDIINKIEGVYSHGK